MTADNDSTSPAISSVALLWHDRLIGIPLALLCAAYSILLLLNIAPYWFNPHWTTDDALQQLFPFYAVLHPHVFAGDLVYEAMRSYLAPLHYLIGAAFTYVTDSPIMTGHWMMLLQLLLSSTFLFLAVKQACRDVTRSWWYSAAPAFFALLWFLHSRQLVQRMTAGLQRGWAPVIICAYLYFVMRRNHRGVLAVLLVGCVLNPPSAFLGCAAYGIYLLIQTARPSCRTEFKKPLLIFLLAAPLLGALTFYGTARSDRIGNVVLLSEARKMPELQVAGGRFSFLPFPSIKADLLDYSFRVFQSKLWPASKQQKGAVVICAALLFITMLGLALFFREELVPLPLLVFGGAALLVYLISRPLAFLLFVPDRYLTYPHGIFFILAFSIGLWRLARRLQPGRNAVYLGALFFLFVGILVYAGHGNGLNAAPKGIANFNYKDDNGGPVFSWIRHNTPESALFAGHPTHLDPLPLFGMRRAFATSETWHPFFKLYNAEIKRRMEVTFRALYAKDAAQFVALLRGEGISYFVFERRLFREEELRRATYYEPVNRLLQRLVRAPPEQYLFYALPLANKKVVPYADDLAVVVNVEELAATL